MDVQTVDSCYNDRWHSSQVKFDKPLIFIIIFNVYRKKQYLKTEIVVIEVKFSTYSTNDKIRGSKTSDLSKNQCYCQILFETIVNPIEVVTDDSDAIKCVHVFPMIRPPFLCFPVEKVLILMVSLL